jgi:hypothetical protein
MTDLTTAKLLISSTISTLGAKFSGIDLANFYLITPMPTSSPTKSPHTTSWYYSLCDIVTPDSWVYTEIQKGMYGRPQAGILANQLVEKRLGAKGHCQCQHTPGLWQHV